MHLSSPHTCHIIIIIIIIIIIYIADWVWVWDDANDDIACDHHLTVNSVHKKQLPYCCSSHILGKYSWNIGFDIDLVVFKVWNSEKMKHEMFRRDNLQLESLAFRHKLQWLFFSILHCPWKWGLTQYCCWEWGDRTCGWICRHKGRTSLFSSKGFQSNGRLSPLSPSPINQLDPLLMGASCFDRHRYTAPLHATVSNNHLQIFCLSTRNLKKWKKDCGETRDTWNWKNQ
jgi:hypothetical protein